MHEVQAGGGIVDDVKEGGPYKPCGVLGVGEQQGHDRAAPEEREEHREAAKGGVREW